MTSERGLALATTKAPEPMFFCMQPVSHEDLFLHDLKCIRSAETQFVEGLPKLIAASAATQTVHVLRSTWSRIKLHLVRLELLRRDFSINLKGLECGVTSQLLGEASVNIASEPHGRKRDEEMVGIAAQIVANTVALYMSAEEKALFLGLREAALLLATTIEEKQVDESRLCETASALSSAGTVPARS